MHWKIVFLLMFVLSYSIRLFSFNKLKVNSSETCFTRYYKSRTFH